MKARRLQVALRVIDDSKAGPVLKGMLADAVATLNGVKAFEPLYIPQRQDIYIRVETGLGFIARPTRSDRGDLAFSFGPTQVIVGSQALTGAGCVGQLAALGAPPEHAMLCCLAHELFHVDEPQRLSSQGVTFYEANSRFSWAIRPSFSRQHNDLLRLCARKYQGGYAREPSKIYSLMPVEVARAQDVSSELCADLLALHWMRQAGINTAAIEQALLALRIKDEAKLAEYQIGSEMGNLLNLASYDDIVQATASRSVEILATAPTIDPIIQSDALSLALPVAMSFGQVAVQGTLPKATISERLSPDGVRHAFDSFMKKMRK